MSKENRESIELPEDKLFITGEITPFKAYIPMEEGCKLDNLTMHNFRPTIGQAV